MAIRVQDVLRVLERMAPSAFALPGDPVGLQIGSPELEVERIFVALDADPRTVTKAIYHNCQLLITHHPLIYRPLSRVDFDDPVGSAVQQLCAARMAYIAVHTNWDCAPGGVNDALAEQVGLEEVRPFGSGAQVPQFKVATFVPPAHLDAVLDRMAAEGAGEIGLYRRCAFYHPGTGTYEPQPGATPYQGTVGRREHADEMRLEVLVPAHRLQAVIRAMLQTHPYEEVAYDVYPLHTPQVYPLGRVGRLPRPMRADELRDHLAERLGNPYVRFYGKPGAIVRTLAVIGGSGSEYLREACAAHADALLTGEVRHHHTWEAWARDLVLFEGGHRETELPGVRALAQRLHEQLPSQQVEVLFEESP
ncbi:MAG: Nif3-like dinuclear metal center hexameric protein [Fimbriimonadales bacterium]|nr:Nif3-like dinuclear metal center hexameric protein [Fimbriimonadales bacterium]